MHNISHKGRNWDELNTELWKIKCIINGRNVIEYFCDLGVESISSTNKSQKDFSFKWTNRKSYEQTIYKDGNIKTKNHVEMIQMVIKAMELKKTILF